MQTASSTTALASPRAAKALSNLEDSVGGRDSLVDTLILAKLDDRQQHFVRMLVDPARGGDSLAKICKDAGMKPADLLDLYRSASFAKANAVAMGRAADAIPAVVTDLASKSVDMEVQCKWCRGKGCDKCNQMGTVLRESDLDRQKTLLDIVGLGKKPSSGATIINTNAQINTGNAGSLFSTFVRATDKAAYDVSVPSEPVIDAETVKSDG